MEFIALGIMALTFIPLIIFEILGQSTVVIFFKFITSILFFIIGVICYRKNNDEKSKNIRKFFLLGLLFSVFADLCLAIDTKKQVIFYIGSFTFAFVHFLYIAALIKCKKISLKDIFSSAIIAIPLVIFSFVGKFDFGGMTLFSLLYEIVVSFMMVKALSLKIGKCDYETKKSYNLIALGGVLFWLSDFVFFFMFFYTEEVFFANQSLNWILYYLSQVLIAMSLKYKINVEDKVNNTNKPFYNNSNKVD